MSECSKQDNTLPWTIRRLGEGCYDSPWGHLKMSARWQGNRDSLFQLSFPTVSVKRTRLRMGNAQSALMVMTLLGSGNYSLGLGLSRYGFEQGKCSAAKC